jgi:HEPN domain-containing protein
MRPETEPWWRQAEADLQTAEVTMAAGQFYAVSWFAQQAAEKALKGLYLERHGHLPSRTHDLRFLGAQLQVSQAQASDLAILYPTFRAARYPDDTGTAPVDAIGQTAATQHLEAARRTLEWVRNELGRPSTRP